MEKHFNNQNNQYPVILIPKNILKNLEFGIDREFIKQQDYQLRPPKLKNLPEPKRPNKIIYHRNEKKAKKIQWFPIVMTIFWSAVIGLFFGLIVENWINKLIFIGLITSIGLVRLLLIGKLTNIEVIETQFKEELSDEEFASKYSEYEIQKKQYEKKKPLIYKQNQLLKHKYEKEKQEKLNRLFLAHHKASLAPQIEPIRIFSPKRGLLDLYFLELINDELNGLIHADVVPKYKSYFPDLTLICPSTMLHIDIEIDEPYTLKNKEPIHFKEFDEKRNDFFLKCNWCIIRFTENQIVNYPNQCIQTIKSVYHSIIELRRNYNSYLKTEQRWTYEEALIMGSKGFRESYLKKLLPTKN